MNVLDVADKKRILDLLGAGWSIRRVARESGHRHETIRRYGVEAGILQSKPGAKPHTLAEVPTGSKPHTLPTEVPTGSPRSTRSSAEPFRPFIEVEFGKGRNAKAICYDLVEHHGYDGSYDAVKRLIRTLRKHEPKVFCRFETPPGQEAQVDYGEGAPALDPRTGKYRKPRLFVMTLSNCAMSLLALADATLRHGFTGGNDTEGLGLGVVGQFGAQGVGLQPPGPHGGGEGVHGLLLTVAITEGAAPGAGVSVGSEVGGVPPPPPLPGEPGESPQLVPELPSSSGVRDRIAACGEGET